jgi:hypothetical protein
MDLQTKPKKEKEKKKRCVFRMWGSVWVGSEGPWVSERAIESRGSGGEIIDENK